eukprot:1149464-Pelagomonas_calceolata.AAC.4
MRGSCQDQPAHGAHFQLAQSFHVLFLTDATNDTGLLNPVVGTERLQRLHLGLTQLLIHSFNILAKQHGNMSQVSRVLMR